MNIPLPHPDYEWHPISRAAVLLWTAAYVLFFLHVFRSPEGTLFDNVDLIVHEAGHLLFGWLGHTPGLWGGSVFQLMVPAALAVSFAWRGHTAGTAFCGVAFFHNLLYVARYVSDARAQEIPLVNVGGGDVIHDWFAILSSLGLLAYDTKIGGLLAFVAWVGMPASAAWLVWMHLRIASRESRAFAARA